MTKAGGEAGALGLGGGVVSEGVVSGVGVEVQPHSTSSSTGTAPNPFTPAIAPLPTLSPQPPAARRLRLVANLDPGYGWIRVLAVTVGC